MFGYKWLYDINIKMSCSVKSYHIPGQEIGPALPTQHLCSRFKSSFIRKNHHIWDFQLLIIHKQNLHTEINQPAVTAKIISQPGTHLCVESVAVRSWQTNFHGLNERLSCHVQHSSLIWTQNILAIHQRIENIPVRLWYSEPVTKPANMKVFSKRQNWPKSACSTTMWL
jgi:hypothetical protein